MSATVIERRQHRRAAVSLMGCVRVGEDEWPIVVLSLSAAGAMIQASEQPEIGAVYQLSFSVNKQHYDVAFRVVDWLQRGEAYGWHGPFVDISAEHAQALGRAVEAVDRGGLGTLRPWDEVLAEATSAPDGRVIIGATPAGADIAILGSDALEMGREGVELYARLEWELETM